MSEELKPCPFCGGEAEVVSMHYRNKDLTLWQVRCKTRPYDVDDVKECYTADSFISFDNKEQAIEAWNTRSKRTCEMPMVFEDDEGNELDSSAAYFRYYRCSNCGEIMEHYKYEHWSYCPNCGAKVRGVAQAGQR